jgi:hypothetical protein
VPNTDGAGQTQDSGAEKTFDSEVLFISAFASAKAI